MPQRRAPELRPVMRPSYGACSASFCRRNTGRRTVDWRRAGFAAFAARFAAKAAAERCSDVLVSAQKLLSMTHYRYYQGTLLYQQSLILAKPWTAGLLRRRAIAYSETETYT